MAGSKYLLDVHIGPKSPELDTLIPEETDVFPEDKIEWEHASEQLQVIFNEPNHSPKPQTGKITIAKRGSSSHCKFSFKISKRYKTFLGRIVVLHKNRVIQTALLKGQVLNQLLQTPDYPIRISIESTIRKDLRGIGNRPKFDIAFVSNHTENGTPTLLTVAEDHADFNSLKNVETVINKIICQLQQIVENPDLYPLDIFDEKIVSCFRELSFSGRELYEGIILDGSIEDRVKNAKHIQLLSKRIDYLPLEFLYDISPPALTAPLCPKTKKALQRGECNDCDIRNLPPPTKYICPLGFWFLKMIVERHLIADDQLKGSGDEFRIDFEPRYNEEKLWVFRNALFAASQRINESAPENSQKLLSLLQNVTKNNATGVENWEEWENTIKTKNPSLLVIITHTTKDKTYNQDQMEIGKDSRLFKMYVNKQKHVQGSESNHPVVLLLGCETAKSTAPLDNDGLVEVDVPFQTFAAKFVREGAVIVVTNLTKILARHAVPVAETLINELMRSAQEGKSLGDTLLQTRKKYFIEGIPMALTLIANGDADWQFTLTGE